MFIRWKRRPKKSGRHGRSDKGDSLYCVLVESNRVNGLPRQKVICYLGSVDEGNCDKLYAQVNFWDHVVAKLDKVGLVRIERAKIEESLKRVVSRPKDDEAEQFRKERELYWQKMRQLARIARMFQGR